MSETDRAKQFRDSLEITDSELSNLLSEMINVRVKSEIDKNDDV